MKNNDAYDPDSCDEECTGQPPDGDQSFIVPRRGLEPDSGPDDEPMIVERRGSPADTDSLVFEEDMGEYPDEFPDNSDEPFVSMYEMASKQRQEKRKKKQKKKAKKKARKKANASSEGVDLLELAAFVEGGDEDAQFTDGEQESPAKGRFRQPSVCQMEEDLLEKTDFLYRKSVLYHYNDRYYESIDAEGVVSLYRQYISPGLDGVKNLRNHLDIYKCMKANPRLKYEDSLKDKPYCPLKNGILYLNKMKLKHHSSKRITFTVLDACYDEDAECPVFDEFLDTITEGREDLKERFMMALGYLLIEPSSGKYFFVMGYAPNSGKSILGNTIQKLYPENSVSNLSLGELGGKFETESLLYSRINISLDLPQEVLNASAVSKLKRITGGDSIEIQRKNQGSLKLDHNMKFLFATNFPLRIDSNDPAFLDRIIFLPFMNSVPKDERDPDLAKKLWKERDAIVTKALQYARKLMKQGWQFPPIPDVDCMRGIQRKNSMDYLKEFLENHCEMGDYNYFTATSDLRRAYEACCGENGTCPCSATAFNKYMEQAGGVRDRKRLTASENPVWGFYGIRLRP